MIKQILKLKFLKIILILFIPIKANLNNIIIIIVDNDQDIKEEKNIKK